MGCNSSKGTETQNQNKPEDKPAEGGNAEQTQQEAPAEAPPAEGQTETQEAV